MENILPELPTDLQWKIQVILASSDSTRIMKPLVKIQLHPGKELEFTMEAFAEFRCKVAEALKILQDTKENTALKN